MGKAARPARDRVIADALARSVLGEGADRLDPVQPGDHLEIVARAAVAEQTARELLHQSVAAARGSGHSWAAIGSALGMSRQGAQQRFGGADREGRPGGSDTDGAATTAPTRWLGPVTAFDEMPELDLAGRQGWRTVEAGMLKHKMVRTQTQWEHKRVVWTRPVSGFTKDGWEVGARAFPWLYLVRDLGIPPQE